MRARLILSRVPLLLQQIGLGVLLGLIQLLLFFLDLSRFGMYVAVNLSFIPGLVLYLGFPVVAFERGIEQLVEYAHVAKEGWEGVFLEDYIIY